MPLATKPKRESLPTDIHKWSWSFNALMPDGTKVKFKGSIEAPNCRMGNIASDRVDKMMRTKYPKARWWRGSTRDGDIDSLDGRLKIGPTVQRGKFLRVGEAA